MVRSQALLRRFRRVVPPFQAARGENGGGLLLHLVWSPVTKNAFSDMGTAMKEPSIRKFLVEHPVMMIGGVALVHAAKILSRKASNDGARHRRMAIFVGIALVLFFVRSPWPWQSVPREWLRLP